jgi:hypothetical protein
MRLPLFLRAEAHAQREAAMQVMKEAKTRVKRTSPAKALRLGDVTAEVSPRSVQSGWGMRTDSFARLTGFSQRKIAQLRKTGAPMTAATRQRLAELDRLRIELSKIVKADVLAKWMETPNDSFGGLKPLEVVERGETDRLWRMCYQLASGEPG